MAILDFSNFWCAKFNLEIIEAILSKLNIIKPNSGYRSYIKSSQ